VTQTSIYVLTGGTVTIRYSPGVVILVGASPKSQGGPWSTEVEKSGPDEVRVTFESDDHVSEFRAEWDGGELKVEKEEYDGGDD